MRSAPDAKPRGSGSRGSPSKSGSRPASEARIHGNGAVAAPASQRPAEASRRYSVEPISVAARYTVRMAANVYTMLLM
jgi:hypothetical protein